MHKFRHLLRSKLPNRHKIFQIKGVRWLAPWLDHPNLWCFHRRNVALAVAIGLFSGLMPGPTQMLTAGILAVILKVNLPVTLLVTLYTNPLTYVPLYYLAYRLGCWLTATPVANAINIPPDWQGEGLFQWCQSFLAWIAQLGWPLLVGVPALGLTLALMGYVLTRLIWRCVVVHAWKNRHRIESFTKD